MPATYQDRALRGKLSMLSRQTKVLGVNTESLSTPSLRPRVKQAMMTILLIPTLVNCHNATHQQSSIFILLSPDRYCSSMSVTLSKIHLSSQAILNSLMRLKKFSSTFSLLALSSMLPKRTSCMSWVVLMVLYMTAAATATPKRREQESLQRRQTEMTATLKHSKMRLIQLSQQLCRQTASLVLLLTHSSISHCWAGFSWVAVRAEWQFQKLLLTIRADNSRLTLRRQSCSIREQPMSTRCERAIEVSTALSMRTQSWPCVSEEQVSSRMRGMDSLMMELVKQSATSRVGMRYGN